MTKHPIEVVLEDGNITPDKLDFIILVGGSTRIPYVKRYINEFLHKEPVEVIDPDLSVALGAAVQAGILNDEISQEEGILLTDVNPYALGVRTSIDMDGFLYDDNMEILIPRNIMAVRMSVIDNMSSLINMMFFSYDWFRDRSGIQIPAES